VSTLTIADTYFLGGVVIYNIVYFVRWYIIFYMKTMKAYKFIFYPEAQQAEQLGKEFGCARFVWNQGLIRREYAFQQWGVSLSSAYDISSQITGLKKLESHAWLKDANGSADCAEQLPGR